MEREKMIEEIAKKVCIACGKCKELKGDCYLARNVASVMIDDGYRKIPDGSVVLTKEEYERLASYISEERAREIFHEETEKLKEKIRKETAREIIRKVGTKNLLEKGKLFCDLTEQEKKVLKVYADRLGGFLRDLAKQYGVEVEE